MTPFENELKKALQRRQPPEDFSARLFKRLAAQPPKKAGLGSAWRSGWRLQWVAALLLLMVAGSLTYRAHLRAVRGEAAKQQLMVAMRIASKQLRGAQTRVKEIEMSEMVIQ